MAYHYTAIDGTGMERIGTVSADHFFDAGEGTQGVVQGALYPVDDDGRVTGVRRASFAESV